MNFSEMERGLDTALKSSMNTRGTPVAPVGPFDRAHSALAAASIMAERIGVLRVRLLGSGSETGAIGGHPKGEGVFNELDAHAYHASAMLDEAEAALAAIERALP